MNTLPNYLKSIIENGESTIVEFKEAKNKLPSTLFETICSMLNRNGGHIFLGINDSGKIIGVYKDNVKEMKKNFVNLCNNSEKIFPTIHIKLNEYEVENKIFCICIFTKVLMFIRLMEKFLIEMKTVILI